MNAIQKCGYVVILGRPNVGKSTLLNTLVGKKISITTPKPQTTRHQILGIKTFGTIQAVFIDTPGIHKAEKEAINRYLNRLAQSVIPDADLILFMIEAGVWRENDELVLQKIKDTKAPVILVMNKIDKIKDKGKLLPFIAEVKEKYPLQSIIPISSKKNENLETLEKIIADFLPENMHFFPDNQVTDKNLSFQAMELIREKLIEATEEELPYTTTVTIDDFKEEEALVKINAIIWVEREGQKPIVIGKNGERLKKIGTLSRKDIEKLLNKKVFLRLWVKVKSNWTHHENTLQSFLTS